MLEIVVPAAYVAGLVHRIVQVLVWHHLRHRNHPVALVDLPVWGTAVRALGCESAALQDALEAEEMAALQSPNSFFFNTFEVRKADRALNGSLVLPL